MTANHISFSNTFDNRSSAIINNVSSIGGMNTYKDADYYFEALTVRDEIDHDGEQFAAVKFNFTPIGVAFCVVLCLIIIAAILGKQLINNATI